MSELEAAAQTVAPQSSANPQATLADVRSFLAGLESEFPELFAPPAPRELPLPPALLASVRVRAPGGAEALAAVAERVELWARRMDARYAKVGVRDMTSLWGSCSPKGNLSFNRRLLEAPPEVLDYVVVHELAHLREANHSKRFWRIVNHFCPEHKDRRRWLRLNADGLLPRRPG